MILMKFITFNYILCSIPSDNKHWHRLDEHILKYITHIVLIRMTVHRNLKRILFTTKHEDNTLLLSSIKKSKPQRTDKRYHCFLEGRGRGRGGRVGGKWLQGSCSSLWLITLLGNSMNMQYHKNQQFLFTTLKQPQKWEKPSRAYGL